MRKTIPIVLMTYITFAWLAGCQRAPAPTPPLAEVLAVTAPGLASDPQDPAWTAAPEFIAPLFPQNIVEPRMLNASVPEVRVKAMTDGAEIAFRMEWADSTQNDVAHPDAFSDACAVQLPANPGPDAPPPQMGELGKRVSISYWRAFWQAAVEGRAASIKDLYPNAAPDHYPFNAPILQQNPPEQEIAAARYAPARAVGNQIAAPPNAPVQDLIAEGPGTVSPAPAPQSRGQGQRTPDGWAVVIIRPLPATLAETARSQVAFAVWEGAKSETGSRKMITNWLPLTMQRQKPL